MKVKIKKGRNLTKTELSLLVKEMGKNFEEDPKKSLNKLKNEKDSLFFLLKNEKNILCFGFLRPERIVHLNKKYNFFGIRNVISVKKKKGYGKKLMKKIIEFLNKNKKTGIGFTGSRVAKFYKKSGFKTRRGLRKRFFPSFCKGDNKIENWGFYIEGEDKFISNLIKSKISANMHRKKW